jgi:hypothetical protein
MISTITEYRKAEVVFQDGFVPPEAKLVELVDSLIEQHFKSREDVSFYAFSLCLSKKVLNKRLKDAKGCTMSQLIRLRVTREAINLVKGT